MDAAETVGGEACIVVDRATVQYRVPSTEQVESTGILGWLRSRRRTVTVNALNQLSLVVRTGETVGIIGRNGSGKTTLTKLISGQSRPTTGTVHASSTPVLLGVNAALVPELSGEQNIVLGCLAMGLSRDDIDERFDAIVELSGLGKAIHLPMRSYSSGMSSRLRFAIGTSIDPEILLIDEALNTGDAQFAGRSKARMTELREQAGCVLIVSHNLETITDLCTRALWVDQGDLLMDGEPQAVVAAYTEYSSRLAAGDGNTATRMRAEARERVLAA